MTTMFFHTDTEPKIDFSFENGQVTLYGDTSSVAGKDFIYGVDKASSITPYYFKLINHIPRINQDPLFNRGLSIGVKYYIEDYNQRYNEIIFSFPILDFFLAKYLMKLNQNAFINCHEDEYHCRCENHDLQLNFYAKLECISNNYKYVGSGKLRVKSEQPFEPDFTFRVVERIRGLFSFMYDRTDIFIGNVILNGHHEILRKNNTGHGNDNDNLERYTKPVFSTLYHSETNYSIADEFKYLNPFKDVDFSKLKNSIESLICMVFNDETASSVFIHILSVNYRFEFYFRLIAERLNDEVVIGGTNYPVHRLDKLKNKLFYIIRPDSLVGMSARVNRGDDRYRPLCGDISEVRKREIGEDKIDWSGLHVILHKYLVEPYCDMRWEDLIELYIKLRDKIAHGYAPHELLLRDLRHSLHSIRIVDCMNYCLVLKMAGYSDETISNIIDDYVDNYWSRKH